MQTNQLTILQMVANGRITPAEAERLLIAGSEGRETVWALVAGLVFAAWSRLDLQQLSTGAVQIAHRFLPVAYASVQRTNSLIHHLLGGAL